MKSLNKKLPVFLLAASIANPLHAIWKQAEKSLTVATDYSTYQAELMRDSDNQFRKTWFITDDKTGNIIGDEQYEAKLFEQLALTATIARHTSISQALPSHLAEMKSNFEKLIRLYNVIQIAETTMGYSSQLEGMLVPSLFFYSPKTTPSSQFKSIQTLAKRVGMKFAEELAREIYVKGNESEIEKTRKKLLRAEKMALAELELASNRLGKAIHILNTHGQQWRYGQASEFYSNWRDGIVYGQANARLLLLDIDPVTPDKLGKVLSVNSLNGLGIPIEILDRIPNTHRYLTRPDLKHLEHKYTRHLEDSAKTFSPIENYFIGIEQPINPSLPDIAEYTKQSKGSELAPQKWEPDSVNLSRGERKCYGVVIKNQTGNRDFKSLEIIIDNISPLNAKDIQVPGINASAAQNIKYWQDVYRHDAQYPPIINDAICIETTPLAQSGSYTLNYTFSYEEVNGKKIPPRHFIKTIKVN